MNIYDRTSKLYNVMLVTYFNQYEEFSHAKIRKINP